ncbi:hypothetical protein AN958_12249, partial [Leucoagaricus sp. SymC.cos]
KGWLDACKEELNFLKKCQVYHLVSLPLSRPQILVGVIQTQMHPLHYKPPIIVKRTNIMLETKLLPLTNSQLNKWQNKLRPNSNPTNVSTIKDLVSMNLEYDYTWGSQDASKIDWIFCEVALTFLNIFNHINTDEHKTRLTAARLYA